MNVEIGYRETKNLFLHQAVSMSIFCVHVNIGIDEYWLAFGASQVAIWGFVFSAPDVAAGPSETDRGFQVAESCVF